MYLRSSFGILMRKSLAEYLHVSLLLTKAYWAVSMFDYFHVTQVWVKFWWRDATMAWFRYKFCDPRETYNTLCTVPLLSRPEKEMVRSSNNFETVDIGSSTHHSFVAIYCIDLKKEWCQMNFGATNCTSIRDDAKAATTRFLYSFYSGVSVWTIFFMLAVRTFFTFLITKRHYFTDDFASALSGNENIGKYHNQPIGSKIS